MSSGAVWVVMDDATSSSDLGRGDSFAIGADETNARPLEATRGRGHARRYALVGLGLFALAWLLGGIGETQGLRELVPYADTSLGLGFVLALFGAVVAGTPLKGIVPIGVISGIGHFYKGQEHITHVQSGWGLGLEHTPHILLGGVLIGVATITAAVMAFYFTRGGDSR